MSTGLRIDVNYIALGVSSATGIAIAKALPQIWSKVYSEKYRVFLDTKLVQAAITAKDEKLADAASILVVDARLSNIVSGLNIIGGDNRLATLATDDGLSAEELKQEVKRFQTVYFRPLFATGFSDSDPASQAYLRDRRLDIADLERRAAGIDHSLAELRDYQATMDSPATPLNAAAQPGNDSVQIGRGALGQIIGLAKTVSFSRYVTKLLDQRQSLVDDMSSLHKQIDLVTSADNISDRAAFRQQASGALQTLTKHYQDLLAKARERTIEQSSQFYRELASPAIVGSLLTSRAAILLALAFLAGLFLAVVYALVNPLIAGPAINLRQGRISFNAEAMRIPELKEG
ncbi:MAG: hypothetical protein WBA42_10335 [Mesorhizobium sp.]